MEQFATAQQVWVGGLIMFRVGSMVMVMPGVGETYVPARLRLCFALLIAICLAPVVAPTLPPPPADIGGMMGALFKEVLVGLMIGLLLRVFMSALTTAGELVSLQTTLSFAQTANPTEATPGTTVSTFLSILGFTLVFATNLHGLFIAAIARSYTLFPPAKAVMLNDGVQLMAQTVGKCFALGLQLAAPVVAFSLVFNLAIGLIGRALPQFQVFFVATPLTLILGLSIFALSLGGLGLVWMQAYDSFIQVFI